MPDQCYVIVTKDSDNSEAKRLGPMPHHKARNVYYGMIQRINLADYSIRISTKGVES